MEFYDTTNTRTVRNLRAPLTNPTPSLPVVSWIQFLESFLTEGQRLRLAVRMKGLYRAVMGNASGFYALDLRSAQGRMTAIKVSVGLVKRR